MNNYPIKLTMTAVPVRVERRSRGKVTSANYTRPWSRVVKLIEKQIAAGGAVDVTHRRVDIPRQLKTSWGAIHPLDGAFITDVADVVFTP